MYANDPRFRECPERCDGGILWEFSTKENPEPECGVCFGDGKVWEDEHRPVNATEFIDHSGLRHTCSRCKRPATV